MVGTCVQAWVDERIRRDAEDALREMGLSVSEAFRLFLVKTAKERALPFDIWRPNPGTVAALRGAEEGGGSEITIPQLRRALGGEQDGGALRL